VNNKRTGMRLVVQAHFTTKRYNRSSVVGNSVIRPGRVVEMLDLTSFVAASCLECPQHKVRRVFGVRQGDTDVTVLFLLTLGLRPVQLALWLNTSIYNNC